MQFKTNEEVHNDRYKLDNEQRFEEVYKLLNNKFANKEAIKLVLKNEAKSHIMFKYPGANSIKKILNR